MGRATVTTGKGQIPGQRGFTLIELLIVVTLIVVLAGIGLSLYSTSVNRAKEAVLRENLFQMRNSIDQFYADKGTYPPDLTSLVTEGYMRQIPRDPFTESAETWQIVMSEPDPASPVLRRVCSMSRAVHQASALTARRTRTSSNTR